MWNFRTIHDIDNIDRLERRIALVSKELARLNVDIAALTETRLSGEGWLKETGYGYTLFEKSQDEGERKIRGVGLAIKTCIIYALPLTLTAIKERLMTSFTNF